MDKTKHDIGFLFLISLGTVLFAFSYSLFFPVGKPDTNADTYRLPQLNIGCSHIVWKEESITQTASVKNLLGNIRYTWWIDGENESTGPESDIILTEGVHTVRVVATNGTLTLEKEIVITAVSSAEGILAEPKPSEFYGTWKFQTYFNGVPTNVPGTQITFDDNIYGISEQCKPVSINGVRSGTHTWSAQYHGQNVGSGIIEVPVVEQLKISGIDIAPRYKTGDTISTKLVVTNVGTMDIHGFHLNTLIVNNKYVWMGDTARRERDFDHTSTLRPGESAHIPISTTIPEKVSGIRPTGQYTIDLEITYGSQKSSFFTLKTEVV